MELVSLLQQWTADYLIKKEIAGLKGLIEAGDSMHLIVVRTVYQTTLAACLFAYLAE